MQIKYNGVTIATSGRQISLIFPNGRGASVINDGYGKEDGLFEVAVLGPDGTIDYSTPITDDVCGWLTDEKVTAMLVTIAALAEEVE